MFSDPLLAHKDTVGATSDTESYDRMPTDGSNNTRYQRTTPNAYGPCCIRLAHANAASGVKARKRHLLSITGPTLDASGDPDLSVPEIVINLTLDIPDVAMETSASKIQYMVEQLTGMVRGNSINDASVATDWSEFLTPFLQGQS